MAANRRLYMNKAVHFVTTRIESGLPFVAVEYIQTILKSILARACELYPVKTSDIKVMGNHLHFLMVVISPQDVDQFMRYFKTESAHAINRLLGRKRGRVWEDGYDAPAVLDLGALIDRVIYIYTNAQKAGLVDHIEQYPNLSSWQEFVSGRAEPVECLRISRLDLEELPRHMSPQKWQSLKRRLEESVKARESQSDYMPQPPLMLLFDPRAAFDALDDGEMTCEQYRELVVRCVREREQELIQERNKAHKRALGAKALKEQSPYREHIPESFGKRMICLAVNQLLRKEYIKTFKSWVDECRAVYRRWKEGDYDLPFPAGFIPPGTRPRSSLIPSAFWV